MTRLKIKAILYISIEEYIKKASKEQKEIIYKISTKEIENEIEMIVGKENLEELEKVISKSKLWFIKESYLKVVKNNLLNKELERFNINQLIEN